MNTNKTLIMHYNVDSQGNPIDVKIDREPSQVSSIHNTVQLEQIPSETHNIVILDDKNKEMYEVDNLEDINESSYYVNYNSGLIHFHPSKAGKTHIFSYYGKGYELLSASRIYDEHAHLGRYIFETLQELIDRGRECIDALNTIGNAVELLRRIENYIIVATELDIKLRDDISKGNVLHITLTNDIEIGTALKTSLEGTIAIGNTTKANLETTIKNANDKKIELEGTIKTANTSKTNLDTSINLATIKKTELDTSIANAQDDINTINAVSNRTFTVPSTAWVGAEPELSYILEHNLGGVNLIVGVIDDDTKLSTLPDYKSIDSMKIELYATTRRNITVTINKSAYSGNDSEWVSQEVINARKGEVSLKAKIDSVDTNINALNNEIITARGSDSTLDERLDGVDLDISTTKLKLKKVSILEYGAKGDGITDDTIAIQTCFDTISANGGGHIIIPNTGHEFLISETLQVKSNIVLEFQGSFIKLTKSTTYGGILICVDYNTMGVQEDITIINPLIDGNDMGYPNGHAFGENGIGGSKCKNIRVIGGYVKNCRRGVSNPIGTGGKAVQFENGVKNIYVEGLTAENCTVLCESGGILNTETEFRTSTEVVYTNLKAINCERLISLMHTMSPPNTSVDINSFVIDGVVGFNCGLEEYGTIDAYGLILNDRASNVTIKNVTVVNSPTYGTVSSIIRMGKGENCVFSNINFNGNAKSVINCDIPTQFGSSGIFNNNIFENIYINSTIEKIILNTVLPQANFTNSEFDIRVKNITGVIADTLISSATLFGRFTNISTGVVVEGGLNVLANTSFPQTKYNWRGSITMNGVTISYGGAGQIFNATEDLIFGVNNSYKLKVTSRGVALPTMPTSTSGLISGDLWCDTANGNVIKKV